VQTVRIGKSRVSRLIVGGNPFSGFSHQGRQMDAEMVAYYTPERIKATLREAESLGINTAILRADDHIMGLLSEHWREGGKIQWFGQTCPELGAPEVSLERVAGVAAACHIHGGVVDNLFANGQIEELIPAVEYARKLRLTVGLASHNPDALRWAEQNLDVDYYMCSYYNPIARDEVAAHRAGTDELYRQEDRRAMTKLIPSLSKPAIHYKVMAAGRNDPVEAFRCVARCMRPGDAVCVGVYTKVKPDMLKEDVELLEQSLAALSKARTS